MNTSLVSKNASGSAVRRHGGGTSLRLSKHQTRFQRFGGNLKQTFAMTMAISEPWAEIFSPDPDVSGQLQHQSSTGLPSLEETEVTQFVLYRSQRQALLQQAQ